MRRLSQKHRLYLARRAAKLARRKLIWKAWRRKQARLVLQAAVEERGSGRPLPVTAIRREVRLELPSVLSLQDNYSEVLDFVDQLRRFGLVERRPVYADFRPLRRVNPAAALLLAAELDRWRIISRRRLRIKDAHEWDIGVFGLLGEMGLYDLLSLMNRPEMPPPGQFRFIRFRSSNLVLGELAASLRDDLGLIFGSNAFARRRLLYDALVEAMSNARRHAYPEDFPATLSRHVGLWWMSGAYDSSSKRLTIMFYDQGVGIPATLPRLGRREQMAGWLVKHSLFDDDASRIKAAIELGATQTREAHRGLGMLRNIRRYVDGHPNDRLRILSAKGEYTYYGDGSEHLHNHDRPLGGTLIQWELSV